MWSQIIRQEDPIRRFNKSKFRASFRLSKLDVMKLRRGGLMFLKENIRQIIEKKLKNPSTFNDGNQTPWNGSPIFTAMHATATCCRKCLFRWHRIPPIKTLDEIEIQKIASIIYAWIINDLKNSPYKTPIQQDTKHQFNRNYQKSYQKRQAYA